MKNVMGERTDEIMALAAKVVKESSDKAYKQGMLDAAHELLVKAAAFTGSERDRAMPHVYQCHSWITEAARKLKGGDV